VLKPSESSQFGPILRAPIQWVKNASKQWWISVFESDTNRELIHSWTQERFLVPMVKLPTTRLCHRGEPLELRLLFSLRIENPLSPSILTNRRDLLAYLIE